MTQAFVANGLALDAQARQGCQVTGIAVTALCTLYDGVPLADMQVRNVGVVGSMVLCPLATLWMALALRGPWRAGEGVPA